MSRTKVFFIGFILLLSTVGAYHFVNVYFNVPNDNPVEESIEQVIEVSIGIDVDLTPEVKAIEENILNAIDKKIE